MMQATAYAGLRRYAQEAEVEEAVPGQPSRGETVPLTRQALNYDRSTEQ